ncbi:hypothetical protein [Mycolicibacterium vanbaalenii]|uniref:hypothetical protein n=1 Tax=Mycolicibacterium vanbaalenii TaxID=110539 RepID=UPI0021F2A8FA|nr:hypothetical protein [Mycolicibacterium vanbaalenii]
MPTEGRSSHAPSEYTVSNCPPTTWNAVLSPGPALTTQILARSPTTAVSGAWSYWAAMPLKAQPSG